MFLHSGRTAASILILGGIALYWGPRFPVLEDSRMQGRYLMPVSLPETEWGYALPNGDSLFLRIGHTSQIDTPEDYGPRLTLIRVVNGRARDLARSRGFMDTYYVGPVFFAQDSTVILLADTGAEYSWGVIAFEVSARGLTDLGRINVARYEGIRLPRSDTVLVTEVLTDPLPHVRLTARNGTYIAEFTTDLVLDPGGRDSLLVFDDGLPIRFRQALPDWELLGRE